MSKLPEDFPIDRWESLNTKQQRHALKFSGLDDKEQWVLLNASAPLSVLDELNQAQNQAAMRAHITALFSPMASPARQRETASDSLRPYSTSLQNNAWQRELERRREHREQRGYTSPTQTEVKKSGNPIQPVERSSQSGGSGADDGEKETLWEKIASWFKDIFSPEEPPEPASSTPQMFTMVTVPPTASPTPTPSPSHSPTPELTERDQLAQNIVDLALAKADIGYPYQLGGGSDKRGYDCSGLVRALCRDIGSGIKFGQGYISKSCEDGMAEDFIKKGYCDVVFDYHDGAKITSLAPGDLVFFASPNVLSIDKHVAIATGNGLQVVEASDVVHRVTDEFDAYKDDKGNGIYVRDSGQIITYIIRPYYDWKEQP